jgi:hypothetical protein
MKFSSEPRIHPVALAELRPTQITVGMREVEAKRKHWRNHPDRHKPDFLGNHVIPVVWGPKERYYVIDHHHLSLALLKEGVKEIVTSVVVDLRKLPREGFWVYLDNRAWLHPFDAAGRRRAYTDIPKRLGDLVDDPYRSLAGELRYVGGYAKDTTPFSEFLWADFLRRRIKRRRIEEDFGETMERALMLAKSSEANYLPGWCGPVARV